MSPMEVIIGLFLIGLCSLLFLIWSSSKKQQYWKNRGVPFADTIPIIGSVLEGYGKTLQEVDMRRHFTLGSIYGHFEGNRPVLSVAEPKLLRDIFVRDFPVFTNRRFFETGNDISDVMLSNLQGEDWKRVRSIISPLFSIGKLKRVISIFKDCSWTLVNNFNETATTKQAINVRVKKFYEAFIMDVIAMSAFSTKINAHKDPQNKFVQAARSVFGTNLTWRFILVALAPSLMKLLGISVSNPSAMEFFTNITNEIIDERKRSKQKRNDFLQLLIETADEVETKEDNETENVYTSTYEQDMMRQKGFIAPTNKNLSKNELIAQCIIFFVAGFETLAVAFTAATYVLATEKNIQEKVHEEMVDCLKKTNGVLTYEVLQNMKYLDCFLFEVLRMYPPLTRTERKSDSIYKLEDTDIVLEKDMLVSIPIYAMHHDPKYYPNPEKFDPNRFSAEEKGKRDPYLYLPFGSGPRNCVGMRFALLQIKVCLVHVICNFNIETCCQTQIPMQFNRGFGILQPKDTLLQMQPRKNSILVR